MRRKTKKRISMLFFGGLILLGGLSVLPTWHILQIRAAQDRFDGVHLREELTWVHEKLPWLRRIPLIRDSELWLALNRGEVFSDQELLAVNDDKHRFWLFQAKLRAGQFTEAGKILSGVNSTAVQGLGQGLLDLTQETYDSALEKLAKVPEAQLSREEKVLKSLAMSRCYLALGKNEEAESAWKRGKSLAPEHPLVIETEYDLNLAKGDWQEAEALLPQWERVEVLWGNASRPEFLVKKALLELTLGHTAEWEKILATLEANPEDKPVHLYLLAIRDYAAGNQNAAQEKFQEALSLKLPPPFQRDAQKALAQIEERQKAEPLLQKYR